MLKHWFLSLLLIGSFLIGAGCGTREGDKKDGDKKSSDKKDEQKDKDKKGDVGIKRDKNDKDPGGRDVGRGQ